MLPTILFSGSSGSGSILRATACNPTTCASYERRMSWAPMRVGLRQSEIRSHWLFFRHCRTILLKVRSPNSLVWYDGGLSLRHGQSQPDRVDRFGAFCFHGLRILTTSSVGLLRTPYTGGNSMMCLCLESLRRRRLLNRSCHRTSNSIQNH